MCSLSSIFPVAEAYSTPQLSVEIELCSDRCNTNLSGFYVITLQKISLGPLRPFLLECLVMKSIGKQYLHQKSESIHALINKYLGPIVGSNLSSTLLSSCHTQKKKITSFFKTGKAAKLSCNCF